MASYRVAQLGMGWGVFRVDAGGLELVAGPFETRNKALNRLRDVPVATAATAAAVARRPRSLPAL